MNNSTTPRARMSAALLGALALLICAPAAADSLSAAYQRSYDREARGKYAEARQALRARAAGQGSDYFFQIRLAWLSYLAGDHAAAIRSYRVAARLQPRALEPLLGLMLPQMAARRWKDAEATARQALLMAPGNVTAQTRLAWILFNLGRHAEAARAYRTLLRLFPSDLTLRAGLGWALLRQHRKAEARQVFRQVLRVSPKHGSATRGMAALR